MLTVNQISPFSNISKLKWRFHSNDGISPDPNIPRALTSGGTDTSHPRARDKLSKSTYPYLGQLCYSLQPASQYLPPTSPRSSTAATAQIPPTKPKPTGNPGGVYCFGSDSAHTPFLCFVMIIIVKIHPEYEKALYARKREPHLKIWQAGYVLIPDSPTNSTPLQNKTDSEASAVVAADYPLEDAAVIPTPDDSANAEALVVIPLPKPDAPSPDMSKNLKSYVLAR